MFRYFMPNELPVLPLEIKDQILMSPGVWNGITYSSDEIKKAFDSTDWNDEGVLSLFLDHPENPNNAASAWAGKIFNPRLVGNELVGDLKIFDLNTVIKLKLGGANFGVSPRVVSNEEQKDDTFKNFLFDNFSVVSKPAIDTAYIELAKQISSVPGTKTLYKTSGGPNYIQPSDLTQMKGGIIEMSEAEESKEKAAPEESKPTEEAKEESKEEPKEESKEETKEESAASEESKEMNFEDLSAEELDAIIAKANKARDAKMHAVKEMSKEIIAPVSREVEALKEQIKEMSKKLDAPTPKTVRGPVVASENLVGGAHTAGEQEMAAYLERNFK